MTARPLTAPHDHPPRPHRPARAGARALLASLALASASTGALAEKLGDVSTAFQWLGPNHKVVVEAYDDPLVTGVTCYVSRARKGGISGALGMAEDRAEASIACRQVGPVAFRQPLPLQDEVFSERMSLLFKRLRVVRMVDAQRNALVYLSYSDKLIDGSPQNSVSAVPVDLGLPIPLKK
ncbi:MAG: CreA family protein [Burkholderiaceae bacterium]|nr:CreA family protein [Burkholderiaceae bacterium]